LPVIGAMPFPNLPVNHAEIRGRSIITDGLSEVRKYNPATGAWLPCVLRPFRQNVALVAGGAGVLNGDYVYRIVPYNINEDEEGEAFPHDEDVPAFAISVVNQSVNINLAALVADSPEITHVRIYRTTAAGVWPVMALVAEVALPAGVYNDNFADDDLDFENEGLDVFTHVPCPKPFIVQHRERLFMWGDIPYDSGQAGVTNGSTQVTPQAGAIFGFHLITKEFHAQGDGKSYLINGYDPTTGNLILAENYLGVTRNTDYRICGDPDALIWTEENNEHQWAPANTRPVGGKEGAKPTGLFSSRSALICPKDDRIYELYYTTRPNFPPAGDSRVGLLTEQFGGLAHRSWKNIKGAAIGASKHGIIQAGGGLLSGDAQDWFEANLALDGNGTQQTCFAVDWVQRNQYLLFFKSTEAVMGCDKALVWHYDSGKLTWYKFLTEFLCGEIVKDTDGTDFIALGDVNGYVWQFPYGDIDGGYAGATLSGTVTSYLAGIASPGICALVDDNAHFPTTGLGLAGVPVYIYDGTGSGQWAIIISNTETQLLVECFGVDLDTTSRYYIGPIEFWYKTGWMDLATIARVKYAEALFLVHDVDESDVELRPYINFEATPHDLVDERTNEDFGLVDLSVSTGEQKIPLGGLQFKHLALEWYSFKPNNPISLFDMALMARPQDPS